MDFHNNKLILILSISILFFGCISPKKSNEIIPKINEPLKTDINDYNHHKEKYPDIYRSFFKEDIDFNKIKKLSIDADNYDLNKGNIVTFMKLYDDVLSITGNKKFIDSLYIDKMDNLECIEIKTYENINVSIFNNLKNLKELNLIAHDSGPKFDISSISNLENLESLYIWGGNIIDISPIGNLKKLKNLIIGDIEIKDLMTIGSFVNLESLEIYYIKITDISPIGNLRNLKKLVISDIIVKDISAISKLINLETLELYSNKITNISSIGNFGNLIKLKELIINGKRVKDLTAIGNLLNFEIFSDEIDMPPVRYISDNIEIKSPEYIGKTNLPDGHYDIIFKSMLNGIEGFYLSSTLFFDTAKMEVIRFFSPGPMHWGIFRPPFSNNEMPISGHDYQIHVYNTKTHEYYYIPEDNYRVLITDSDRIHLTDQLDTPEYTIAIQSHYRMSYIGKDHKPIIGERGNGTDVIKPILLAEFQNTIFDNPFFMETFDKIISSLNIITKYKLYFSSYREELYDKYGEEYYGEQGKYGEKYLFKRINSYFNLIWEGSSSLQYRILDKIPLIYIDIYDNGFYLYDEEKIILYDLKNMKVTQYNYEKYLEQNIINNNYYLNVVLSDNGDYAFLLARKWNPDKQKYENVTIYKFKL
jgi:hypothetical protein